MAQDLTASQMQIVQMNLDGVFKNKATLNPELTKTPVTGPAILERQSADVRPLFAGSGNACVGTELWYRVANNTTVSTVSGAPIPSECDLTSGDDMSTLKQEYQFNAYDKQKVEIIDTPECGNLAKFSENSAFLIANKMSLMAQGYSNFIISQLDINKSVTSANNLPDAVTISGGGDYQITDTSYWTGIEAAKIIPVLDQLAFVKGLPSNYYIIAGRALSIPRDYARDRAANDNERSYIQTFNRRDIVNDVRSLDEIITAEVIYLIDPAAMFGYFWNKYGEVPVSTNDKNNTIEFSIPFTYYDMYQDGSDNQRPVQFISNGALTTARLDVSYQKVCTDADANGHRSYKHVYEMGYVSQFDFVPSTGDNTGVIRVNKG